MIYIRAMRNSLTAELIQWTNSLGVGAEFVSTKTPLGREFQRAAESLVRRKVIESCGVVIGNSGRQPSTYKVLSLACYGTASEKSERNTKRMFELPDVKLSGWASDLYMYAQPVPTGIGRCYGEWE